VRLTNDEERRRDLAARLTTAGCTVDTRGEDWKRAGDFATLAQDMNVPFLGRLPMLSTGALVCSTVTTSQAAA